ncbi:hypothetical protein CEXT_465911 [Caerostris extrusa]|uniref:Uncharacterized protein n=1 Tax=Caerostris extrusa TaxID=172846 RepID=A0AAV4XU82_CAEEX|nr:hypothetical protein CEXT_465911 [Caerostris extrusa]
MGSHMKSGLSQHKKVSATSPFYTFPLHLEPLAPFQQILPSIRQRAFGRGLSTCNMSPFWSLVGGPVRSNGFNMLYDPQMSDDDRLSLTTTAVSDEEEGEGRWPHHPPPPPPPAAPRAGEAAAAASSTARGPSGRQG